MLALIAYAAALTSNAGLPECPAPGVHATRIIRSEPTSADWRLTIEHQRGATSDAVVCLRFENWCPIAWEASFAQADSLIDVNACERDETSGMTAGVPVAQCKPSDDLTLLEERLADALKSLPTPARCDQGGVLEQFARVSLGAHAAYVWDGAEACLSVYLVPGEYGLGLHWTARCDALPPARFVELVGSGAWIIAGTTRDDAATLLMDSAAVDAWIVPPSAYGNAWVSEYKRGAARLTAPPPAAAGPQKSLAFADRWSGSYGIGARVRYAAAAVGFGPKSDPGVLAWMGRTALAARVPPLRAECLLRMTQSPPGCRP